MSRPGIEPVTCSREWHSTDRASGAGQIRESFSPSWLSSVYYIAITHNYPCPKDIPEQAFCAPHLGHGVKLLSPTKGEEDMLFLVEIPLVSASYDTFLCA